MPIPRRRYDSIEDWGDDLKEVLIDLEKGRARMRIIDDIKEIQYDLEDNIADHGGGLERDMKSWVKQLDQFARLERDIRNRSSLIEDNIIDLLKAWRKSR